MHPGKPEGGVMAARWGEGIWVGKRNKTDEHLLIDLATGKLIKARSIKLKVDSESWVPDDIEKVKVTPFDSRSATNEALL